MVGIKAIIKTYQDFLVFLEFKRVGIKATIKICQICFVLSEFKSFLQVIVCSHNVYRTLYAATMAVLKSKMPASWPRSGHFVSLKTHLAFLKRISPL
jgi:hypothetical protein